MWKFSVFFVAAVGVLFVNADDLFPYGTKEDKSLSKYEEDTSSGEVRLKTPFVFYGKEYDSIFVNENGLLSFSTDVPTFFNIRFPLDYPIIAPFYSDVDLRKAGNVWYRSTEDPEVLQRATVTIRGHFLAARQFTAKSVFIATWDRVGYYDQGADRLNTFQVILVTDGVSSYVIFMYVRGGLEWIQGTGKSTGQPDAKAQAGFVSGDGRFYLLKGSGTDQVINLNRLSNIGIPGTWIFRISTSQEELIGLPDVNIGDVTLFDPSSADSCLVGTALCHSRSRCVDYNPGFCCECGPGYYGNGKSCLQEGAAQRVNGKVEGVLNGEKIEEFDFHSYVVVSDGRVYTAISKVPDAVGFDLQTLVALGAPVSWAFSKAKGMAKNGFQLTGGIFNYTSIISFPESGHKITVTHHFLGLDVFNYLEVHVTIDGIIPTLPGGSKIEMPNHDEVFTSPAQGILKSHSRRHYKLEGLPTEHPFSVETTITFDDCDWSKNRTTSQFIKTSRNFIVYDTREKILRFAATSKVSGSDVDEDPCLRGAEVCTGNSFCVPSGESFKCECKSGYEFLYEETSNGQSVTCIDVNECDSGLDRCHENAQCINEPGTYRCLCLSGYYGDGFTCKRELSCDTTRCGENQVCVEEVRGRPECRCRPGYRKEGEFCVLIPADAVYSPNCRSTNVCNENANCMEVNDVFKCVCNHGYSGDGYICIPDSENCLVAELCSLHATCEYSYENSSYFCKCQPGYEGDGYECSVKAALPTQGQPSLQIPTCLYGVCWCDGDYTYDGEKCVLSGDEPGTVTEEVAQQTSCNVVNNCHPRAQCVYSSETGTYGCRCNAGYEGDGQKCTAKSSSDEMEPFCDVVPDVCDVNAVCIYDDDALKLRCVCNSGYSGNGLTCSPVDTCNGPADCDPNGTCHFNAVEGRYSCRCNTGYRGDGLLCEKENEDIHFSLEAEPTPESQTDEPYQENEIPYENIQTIQDVDCSVFNNCHRHAICQTNPVTNTSRCVCLHGYSGTGLDCQQIRPGCHVLNDCGRNAQCLYDVYSFTYKCQCNEGYKGDGYMCIPVVNCDDDPSICDRNAGCRIQHNGPATCVCREGFVGDGFSCAAIKKFDGDFLFVTQGMSVLRLPFKPTPSNPGRPIQVQPFQTAIGITIDCAEGKVYWGDVASHSIKRSNYDGSHREQFLQHSAGAPEGLAVDHMSRVIYWVDSQSATIEAASLDTKIRRTIINTTLVNPRGIAVHPRRGKLYWSDWYREEPKIEVSNLDGTERMVFLKDGLSLPNSLTIDEERDELCWTDAGTSKVECIGIDGESRRSVSANAKYPFGITNHEGQIYWTDWDEKKIMVADKSTGLFSGSITVPLGGHGKLYGIVAVPNTCQTLLGYCQQENGGCGEDRLCITSLEHGRSCL